MKSVDMSTLVMFVSMCVLMGLVLGSLRQVYFVGMLVFLLGLSTHLLVEIGEGFSLSMLVFVGISIVFLITKYSHYEELLLAPVIMGTVVLVMDLLILLSINNKWSLASPWPVTLFLCMVVVVVSFGLGWLLDSVIRDRYSKEIVAA